MNSYAFVFAALVIAVQGGSLRVVRQTGWGAPPPPPAVDIALAVEGAAVGAGTANAAQGILVVADGTPALPADILLSASTSSAVAQDIDSEQVAIADLANSATSTLNVITVDNIALADESASILALGGNSVSIAVDGSDSVTGAGAISASASSHNQQNL